MEHLMKEKSSVENIKRVKDPFILQRKSRFDSSGRKSPHFFHTSYVIRGAGTTIQNLPNKRLDVISLELGTWPQEHLSPAGWYSRVTSISMRLTTLSHHTGFGVSTFYVNVGETRKKRSSVVQDCFGQLTRNTPKTVNSYIPSQH